MQSDYLYIFLAGYLLSMSMPHLPGRRIILGASVTYAMIYALYMGLNGAYAGAAANIIAAVCALLNGATPERYMRQTLVMRMGVVTAICAAGGWLTFHQPLGCLAVLAMYGARCSELQSNQQNIRIGYLLSGVTWLSYLAYAGLYVMLAFETLRWLSVMVATIRGRRAKHAAGTSHAAAV